MNSKSNLNRKLTERLKANNNVHNTSTSISTPPTTPLFPVERASTQIYSPTAATSITTTQHESGSFATSSIQQCTHQLRTMEGTCASCGQWQHCERTPIVQVTKQKRAVNHSIMKDIQNLPFKDNVKELANQIYVEINNGGVKKKSKYRAIFYCLFQAHQKLGKVIDPCWLAAVVGLKANKTSKAMNYYNSRQYDGEYKNEISYVSPTDLIVFYCDLLHLTEDTTSSIIGFYNMIVAKDGNIANRPPRPTVAGVIHYYLFINGVSVDEREFAEVFRLSQTTISTASRIITNVDNRVTEGSNSPPSTK